MNKPKRTVTTIFMVPPFKISEGELIKNGFLNAYSVDSGLEECYEGCIYLLFRPENLFMFREFLETEYERTKAVIEDYDYDDGFVVVVYQLNEKFKKDFLLIKQSQYSKTSKEFQKLFPRTIRIEKQGKKITRTSLQIQVFEKSEEMVRYWEDKLDFAFDENMEVWPDFNLEKETLYLDKVKEELKQLENV